VFATAACRTVPVVSWAQNRALVQARALQRRASMKFRRAAVGILVIACGSGCGAASGYEGKIVADGRDFGTSRVEEVSYSGTCAWRRYGPRDSGTSSPMRPTQRPNDDKVSLAFAASQQWRGQSGYLELSPDDHPPRVDLRLPWSHVAFTPSNCEKFELHVERAGPEGWMRGRVRLHCSLPDGANTLDVDTAFEGC
jgi:hypothetical protein